MSGVLSLSGWCVHPPIPGGCAQSSDSPSHAQSLPPALSLTVQPRGCHWRGDQRPAPLAFPGLLSTAQSKDGKPFARTWSERLIKPFFFFLVSHGM